MFNFWFGSTQPYPTGNAWEDHKRRLLVERFGDDSPEVRERDEGAVVRQTDRLHENPPWREEHRRHEAAREAEAKATRVALEKQQEDEKTATSAAERQRLEQHIKDLLRQVGARRHVVMQRYVEIRNNQEYDEGLDAAIKSFDRAWTANWERRRAKYEREFDEIF